MSVLWVYGIGWGWGWGGGMSGMIILLSDKAWDELGEYLALRRELFKTTTSPQQIPQADTR